MPLMLTAAVIVPLHRIVGCRYFKSWLGGQNIVTVFLQPLSLGKLLGLLQASNI